MTRLRSFGVALALGLVALAAQPVTLSDAADAADTDRAPTAVVGLDTPVVIENDTPSDSEVEPDSCAQSCDTRAEQSLTICLRTVAALASESVWMDETLSADTCGRAAVQGSHQCRSRCTGETAHADDKKSVSSIVARWHPIRPEDTTFMSRSPASVISCSHHT